MNISAFYILELRECGRNKIFLATLAIEIRPNQNDDTEN